MLFYETQIYYQTVPRIRCMPCTVRCLWLIESTLFGNDVSIRCTYILTANLLRFIHPSVLHWSTFYTIIIVKPPIHILLLAEDSLREKRCKHRCDRAKSKGINDCHDIDSDTDDIHITSFYNTTRLSKVIHCEIHCIRANIDCYLKKCHVSSHKIIKTLWSANTCNLVLFGW